MNPSTVCVLTGDIVKSSALSTGALDAVMTALGEAASAIGEWPDEDGVRYERFRGDGWQMLIERPAHALRACLFARAAVRWACDDAETRIGIGLGHVQAGATLAESAGPAFELSGRGLESLGVHQLWRIEGEPEALAVRALTQGLFAVCDERSRHWTSRQAEIFMWLAQPDAPLMAEVAEAMSVQPQTVQTHFSRAGGHALLEAVHAFEAALSS
ncbi:hypothetical protein [Salinisphaera hydrothermalis]|uniref:Uncharacterized protein n=1 Tax=Salinisphaera hydrothermalis (strain C41B8) TaxID=1304275 RepID=A0A084IHD0_SALHC|nr:hypothetical protein [Salinisphaera hydrothermalis]KEZ76114.1 hypothetical protein C41B8_16609 [Salinisphaera hydrothermalis C41B8]